MALLVEMLLSYSKINHHIQFLQPKKKKNLNSLFWHAWVLKSWPWHASPTLFSRSLPSNIQLLSHPVSPSSPMQASVLKPPYLCTCYSAPHGWSTLHVSKSLLTLQLSYLAQLSGPSLIVCERIKAPSRGLWSEAHSSYRQQKWWGQC